MYSLELQYSVPYYVQLDYCSMKTAGNVALINGTRRILCNVTTGRLLTILYMICKHRIPIELKFVTQICNGSVSDEQKLQWFPQLPANCVDNGLTISENLYAIVSKCILKIISL